MPSPDADPTMIDGPRAEGAGQDSGELFRLLNDHAHEFIRLHELDGRSVYASRSVERLYGRVPTTLFEFAHPEDVEAAWRWWTQVLAGGMDRLRWRVQDRGGNWRWLESAASLVHFHGTPHVLTLCRDVSEQVHAEDASRQSRQDLSLVINTLPVGVVVLDGAGDVLLANPASQRIWGEVIVSGVERWSRSKGYWRESGKRIEPDEWASARALSRGQSTSNELIDIETMDGQSKTIENFAAPLRDADGAIIGAVAVNQDLTARVHAEAALRESERKLNEAHRIAQVGYWESDFEANRVSWSDETRRILGLPPHDTARALEGLRDLVHPEDRPIFDASFARALEGESNFPVEFRVVHPDGEVRHVHTIVDVKRDPTGQVRRAFGAVQDITDRKHAEEAVRESARKLNEAQRIAHLGHWEQDLETGRITASDETYRIFGLRPQEDLRTWTTWQEHVHPADRPIRSAAIEGAVREGLRYEVEYRVVRPDGEIRIVHSQGEVARDTAGRPRHLFGILQDITEHRHAEEARHAAEHRLTHVVASSPAILFTLQIENDELLGIAWMSENVQALLGYSVSETLGPDWWMDNIHTEDRDAVVNPFLADLLNQGYAAAEYRFRHKNGHFRWVRGEARVLRDVSGGIAEVIGSLSDITERKRLENQFWQAQKMEAVGHLAGGVAHDFNNLLTIIIGYSDLVLPDLPPDEREMIAEIRHAADRAAGLTRQLLAFSRRTVLEPKILSLNELVRDHEKMLRRLIGEDVQLTTNLDAAIEPVRADPGQLGQVIMNLAVNARDAMPTGGRLTIETKSVTFDDATAGAVGDAKAGRYVVLAVTDSGIGMTPDVRAHLFEPFFTTKGPGKGTGLGLATVYGIVKQSGGFIAVESEPGRGSVFAIHFPVVATSVPAEPASAGTPLARGTETILVVEDEDAVRSMIRAVLGKAGYQVLQARSGPEALRIAAEHRERIHLLVTDVVMPEMSGRDVVEHLARQRRDFKVLYLSGYTDDAVVRHRVLEAEVAFLQKPFTMSTLTTKVRQLLDESAG